MIFLRTQHCFSWSVLPSCPAMLRREQHEETTARESSLAPLNMHKHYCFEETRGQTFRVLCYNQCYGMNARNPFSYLYNEIMHNIGKPHRMHTDIRPTIRLVEKCEKPDIVAVLEVLGDEQRHQLEDLLSGIGYSSVHTGIGRAIGKSGKFDQILLATRQSSTEVEIPTVHTDGKLGCGGGLVAATINDTGLSVKAAHLAFTKWKYSRRIREEQLGHMQNFVDSAQAVEGRYLVVGDMNSEALPEPIKTADQYSDNQPTCNVHWPFYYITNKCVDHAAGSGLESERFVTIKDRSDHMALLLDLKTI